MDPTLTFTLAGGQILAVTLSSYAETQILGKIAAERAGQLVAAEIEARTYHLGTRPTRDRGYDDRLTVRLGPSRRTLADAMGQWVAFGGKRGGLRHIRTGSKCWVSELACREWLGDLAATGSLGGPGRWAIRRAAGQAEGPAKP